MATAALVDHALELLAPLGAARARRMFGGWGVYLDDLFVSPAARGKGIADALIEACADRCRERGMPVMQWLTAHDNHRAQAVYDRIGGTSEGFLEYELRVE